jgi:Ser/Thr protein kinase RdoA (MazF antagonist)
MLHDIQLRYNDDIRNEACRCFGFDPATLEQLDGSAIVYEGQRDGRTAILKISPGLVDPPEPILGATRAQVLGEMDFILYLDREGVPVALPLASYRGEWVESIPLDKQSCFLVCAFEKVPGFMYPDEDEVDFPDPVLVEWGRLLGRMHRLSAAYRPSDPAWVRPGWESDDLLDCRSLIPGQPLVWQRFEEMIAVLNTLPRGPEVYGLIHGDLHHGNFFDHDGRLIAFDFDAAHHFWYAGDIVIALYNCLPMPRSQAAKRREFSIHFLTRLLRGYVLEKPVEQEWIERLPFFLKFNEILDYSHHHKYWDMGNLSDRRRAILADMRRRIEQEVPVVEFEEGDLQKIVSGTRKGTSQ